MLFGITTLCMGYGLAGLSRRFLVWPASMIWPGDLVVSSPVNNHTHSRSWAIYIYIYFVVADS